MKKAFTLIEMLIVVAILAVLMSIVFRLGSISGADSRRTTTVVKLQKIENCLSGYYAAFGSYPPVKLHGSRDIYTAVDDETGDQDQSQGRISSIEWKNVEAACRSQPFGCEYPGSQEDNEVIESWTEEIAERCQNSQDYPKYAADEDLRRLMQNGKLTGPNVRSGFVSEWENSDWKAIKLFKFGAMSYLLPRYLFMMGNRDIFDGTLTTPAQWDDNNDTPCNPYKGVQFNGWDEVYDLSNSENKSDNQSRDDLAQLANIPSQAVCARWMPNLEGSCRTLRKLTFFGVTVNQSDQTGLGLDDEDPPEVNAHDRCGDNAVTPYLNASITMLDGWWREFYYYSPAPYQSYVVWSAGENGKTFPPWMKIDDLKTDQEKAVEWKSDDIMQMSH